MSAADTSFPLGAGDVHVWWIDLAQVAEGDAVLSLDERARAARLRRPGDSPRWIKARIAMRQILAGYVGVPPDVLRLATADHGKPELVDEPSLRFSLTHAVDRAALAVAWRREVGIDLEALAPALPGRRDLPALMATTCTTAEAAWIAALAEEKHLEAFLKIWTLKEAYLKGIGSGLAREPRTLEITFDEDGAATIHVLPLKGEGRWESCGPAFSLIPLPPSPVEPGDGLGVRASADEPPTDPAMPLHWTLHLLDPGPGWVAALAVAGTEPGVTVYRWPPDSGQSVG